jgi:hypothetical protein
VFSGRCHDLQIAARGAAEPHGRVDRSAALVFDPRNAFRKLQVPAMPGGRSCSNREPDRLTGLASHLKFF